MKGRTPGPLYGVPRMNGYGRRRKNKRTVRGYSYVDCRSAHRALVSKEESNRCQQCYRRERKSFHGICHFGCTSRHHGGVLQPTFCQMQYSKGNAAVTSDMATGREWMSSERARCRQAFAWASQARRRPVPRPTTALTSGGADGIADVANCVNQRRFAKLLS